MMSKFKTLLPWIPLIGIFATVVPGAVPDPYYDPLAWFCTTGIQVVSWFGLLAWWLGL